MRRPAALGSCWESTSLTLVTAVGVISSPMVVVSPLSCAFPVQVSGPQGPAHTLMMHGNGGFRQEFASFEKKEDWLSAAGAEGKLT